MALNRSARRRGSALLTVLWLTAALAAIGLAVANNVRGETDRAATNVEDARAYFVARGAIERAELHMYWGAPDYYQPGQPYLDLSFPGAEARVEVIPESSKLPLNGAPPQTLLRLMLALGLPEEHAEEIVAAIIDWRSYAPSDKLTPFDEFYLAQSPSFRPAHASFQQSEELLLVKGITPDLYYGTSLDGSRAGLRDCLSPFTVGGALDVNTARRETMIAMGVAPEDAAAIVRTRADHPIDYKELAVIQASLGPSGGALRVGGNSMFTLRATARMRNADGKLSDLRRTVGALIKSTKDGYETVRWYDRD
jgi:general secretion pathway protein K